MNIKNDITIINEAVRLGFWSLSPDELIRSISLEIDDEYHEKVSTLKNRKERVQAIIERYQKNIEVLKNNYGKDKLSAAQLTAGIGFLILCGILCYITNWLLAPGGIVLLALTIIGSIIMRFKSFENSDWRYIAMAVFSILSFLIVIFGLGGNQYNNAFTVVCGVTIGVIVFVINISFTKGVTSDLFGSMTKLWIIVRTFWNERILEFWMRRHKNHEEKLLSTETKKNIQADKATALIMNEYNLGRSMNIKNKEIDPHMVKLPVKNGELTHEKHV
jgi:hypothetical protein